MVWGVNWMSGKIKRFLTAKTVAEGLGRTPPPRPAKVRRSEVEEAGARIGVKVLNGQIITPHGRGPAAGAHATVETAGQMTQRFTVTRLAAFGPFGLALPKRKDRRTLFVTIEGDGWAGVAEVGPKREADARRFAALLNASGR